MAGVKFEYMELSADSKEEQNRHAEVLRKYEARRRGKSINLPTAIEEVKSRLRELGQPITLFGEDHADRRERLRDEIAKLELDQEELLDLQRILNRSTAAQVSVEDGSASSGHGGNQGVGSSSKSQKEIIYSPASDLLIEARKDLAVFSFQRAHERLSIARRLAVQSSSETEAEHERILDLYDNTKELALNSSQYGDDRPLTAVRYSASGGLIASGSLGSSVRIWETENFTSLGCLRGHSDRITSISWHPQSGKTNGSSLLASSSADGSCRIWNCQSISSGTEAGGNTSLDEGAIDIVTDDDGGSGSRANEPIASRTLLGHKGVISGSSFHPLGNHIGTCGYDCSWRLWDVESGNELLLQDGHTKECSALAFHPDGSLALSGDAGGVCLLWDLRSGQMIMPMQGHVKKISDASFSPNGFQVATSSVDNTLRIWDMRKKKCGYTLPAHPNIVSSVKYSQSGEVLLTSSFDGTLKLWNSRDYSILRTLVGHSGKVMACDFAPDEKHLVSAGYDRTLKLWAHKDEF